MLRQSLDDLDINGVKGDWAFLNEDAYIAIRYGDTPFEGTVVLPIKPQGDKAAWSWDGNYQAPTLSPSIAVYGNGKQHPPTWHGFLEHGKLREV